MKMFKLLATVIVLLLIATTISEARTLSPLCEMYAYPKECKYGSFSIPNCPYRSCFKGPGERCDRTWDTCAPGTFCLPATDEGDIYKEKCYDLSRPVV